MSTDNQPTAHGPPLDRRTFLRAAGAGAGAVVAGTGAQQAGLSPVGEADGVALTTTVVVGAAAAAAGVAVGTYANRGDTDVDKSSVLEDEVYNAAVSVATGRNNFSTQLNASVVNAPTGESSFANAAWSAIRATITEGITNGDAKSKTLEAAQDALDKQASIAVYNLVQRYNTGVSGLISALHTEATEQTNVLKKNDAFRSPSTDHFDSSVWTDTGTVDNQMLLERPMTLPGDPSNIDDLPDNPKEYGLSFSLNGVSDSFVMAINAFESTNYTSPIEASHPTYDTITVLNGNLYRYGTETIKEEYNNISSNLSTYVDTLFAEVSQGSIDPTTILGPQDMVDQFASDDKRARMAAELAAIGAEVPDSFSYEALISHPDLSADQLWCDLFVKFSGSPQSIEPGMTIASADYEMAFIGYQSKSNDDYIPDTLSGDSDLQIIDVAGVEGEQDATKSAADTANSSGDLNIGASPPDPVVNPGDYDDAYNIVISTESGTTATVPVSAVTQIETGEYVVPASASGLTGSETISSVRVVPVIETRQNQQFVADPTTATEQQVKDAVQANNELVSQIETLAEDDSGGFLGGGGLLGGGGGLVGGVVLAGLGILTLGQLSG